MDSNEWLEKNKDSADITLIENKTKDLEEQCRPIMEPILLKPLDSFRIL